MECPRGNNIYVLTHSVALFDVIKGLINISLSEYSVERIESLLPEFELIDKHNILIIDAKKIEKYTKELDNISIKWMVINTCRTKTSETYWLENGSVGELHEDEHLGVITKAIKTINNDELWFSRRALSTVFLNKYRTESMLNSEGKYKIESISLTKKELKVFEFILKGMTNNEIAERCNVSINTIKTHVSHVIAKSSVSSRKELMAKYY